MNSVFNQNRQSINEVAQNLGVHPATVWRWTHSGVKGRRLKTIRIGGRRFVLRNDLEHFLKQCDSEVDHSVPQGPDQKCQNIAKAKLDAELGNT
ncbi:MAG: hypothetical protein CME32_20405 [Gimesia sp.]|jgi:excisionase family DNA binding protein|uniref:Helix-turn-helix domain protein n=1 Tax=Gimesia chilikensis TaxID=2605989 RepID=A0A517W9P2_9PLAN|nr:hypothetical protein [Gimesia sp.]QDU01968.1 Helix-turn-helix domain protein [Gimesia chilikensis]